MHAWGDHFSPILYTLVPFVWLMPDTSVALLFQTVVLALGAIALYRYALARSGVASELAAKGSAAVLAIVYLLNPSLTAFNLRAIHPRPS